MDKHDTHFELRAIAQEPFANIALVAQQGNLIPAAILPYHFIDFETTMVALPFHKDRQPYEAIAFQYSYHLMDAKGIIQHKSQYLNFEKYSGALMPVLIF